MVAYPGCTDSEIYEDQGVRAYLAALGDKRLAQRVYDSSPKTLLEAIDTAVRMEDWDAVSPEKTDRKSELQKLREEMEAKVATRRTSRAGAH